MRIFKRFVQLSCFHFVALEWFTVEPVVIFTCSLPCNGPLSLIIFEKSHLIIFTGHSQVRVLIKSCPPPSLSLSPDAKWCRCIVIFAWIQRLSIPHSSATVSPLLAPRDSSSCDSQGNFYTDRQRYISINKCEFAIASASSTSAPDSLSLTPPNSAPTACFKGNNPPQILVQ